MSPFLRVAAFATTFALASSASARTELNLAGELPREQTALVRVDPGKRNFFAPGALTWLLSITDLSKPDAEPVKLFSKWSAKSGHDPRVAPGRYRLHIGCSVPGAFGGSFGKNFATDIDAKAGVTYVVRCTGRTAHALNYSVREEGTATPVAEPPPPPTDAAEGEAPQDAPANPEPAPADDSEG